MKEVLITMAVKNSRLIRLILNSSIKPVITASSPPIFETIKMSSFIHKAIKYSLRDITAESIPSVISMKKNKSDQNRAPGKVDRASG